MLASFVPAAPAGAGPAGLHGAFVAVPAEFAGLAALAGFAVAVLVAVVAVVVAVVVLGFFQPESMPLNFCSAALSWVPADASVVVSLLTVVAAPLTASVPVVSGSVAQGAGAAVWPRAVAGTIIRMEAATAIKHLFRVSIMHPLFALRSGGPYVK